MTISSLSKKPKLSPCKKCHKPSSKPRSAFVAMPSTSATNTDSMYLNTTALRQTNALSALTSPKTKYAGTQRRSRLFNMGGPSGVVYTHGSKVFPFFHFAPDQVPDSSTTLEYGATFTIFQWITRLHFFGVDQSINRSCMNTGKA